MSATTTTLIKVLGGYRQKSPTENLTYATAVHGGIYTDPVDYPTPPIDEATFKTGIDGLATKITAAFDGGKKAIADRNQQEAAVTKMMGELAHYVEGASKGDMPTFLKSGFQPMAKVKAVKPPLSQWIRKITQGKNSGQLHLVLMAIAAAAAYEIRYAATVNGTLGAWMTQLVTKTRPAATLTGLMPGATYSIQVRSFSDAAGYSDWSDVVTRIVI